MSHDKIKAAARLRMKRTGEPYAIARRAVIQQYQEAERGARSVEVERNSPFEQVGAQLARHAQEVMAQLAYPSGIAEIQRRMAQQVVQASGIAEAHRRMAQQVVQASGIAEAHRRMAQQVVQASGIAEAHPRMAQQVTFLWRQQPS